VSEQVIAASTAQHQYRPTTTSAAAPAELGCARVDLQAPHANRCRLLQPSSLSRHLENSATLQFMPVPRLAILAICCSYHISNRPAFVVPISEWVISTTRWVLWRLRAANSNRLALTYNLLASTHFAHLHVRARECLPLAKSAWSLIILSNLVGASPNKHTSCFPDWS